MFLLFDKVYVKPEYRMDMERPRGIITPALGDVMLEGIETKFRNLGESYFNVDSYEDLVGSDKQFPNDSELFEFLLSKGSMDIFVNSATYNKLFVKWIKLMYPTITKEDAFRIYNANTTASKLITRQDFTWGSDNEGVDSQKELAKAFEYLTKDQFQGLFKTVTVDENEKIWRFHPEKEWKGASLQIAVDAQFEDVAGNNFKDLLDHSVDTDVKSINQIRFEVALTKASH